MKVEKSTLKVSNSYMENHWKGEATGAARPRNRIILNRRSFLIDFKEKLTSWIKREGNLQFINLY